MSAEAIEKTAQALARENLHLRKLVASLLADVAPKSLQEAEGQSFFSRNAPFRALATAEVGATEPRLAFDAAKDTRYAHRDAGFDHVLHIFCQSWTGIRAAAGSIPGHKLAVEGQGSLTSSELAEVLLAISAQDIRRIVFHGVFETGMQLIEAFAKAGLSQNVYLVLHGNLGQWCDSTERDLAIRAITLAQNGRICRLHVLQNGFDLPDCPIFRPMLLNLAPVIGPKLRSAPHGKDQTTAFMPATSTWRKNLHTTVFGAALNEKIAQIMVYASDLVLPPLLDRKLSRATFSDREGTISLMARVGVVLNVSLVECHPMVGLEAESVDTPCIRGRLNLDYGDDHPYARLVQVDNPLSVTDISAAISRVLDVPFAERAALVADYTAKMNACAIARYREFLL